ncbi:vomeronasal type-1 receptor 4-like [Diceros bicornis minor]|uniref:vomeronasal type-1 receptor 4-like n=1 Tax=Diceros bicornis minor TaxID=77932 RepID=UPI0026ECA28B|nr:vomeronasal type-1 receptor 4-like [Diceros bicornis minor]
MATRDLVIGIIFFIQTIFGILGNFCLLYHYLFFYLTGSRLRSTDLILKHLTVANLSVILSKGVFQTMLALGLKDFLNDIGCKLVFYVHRTSRNVSIGITCLLSVFQAITISPLNSMWAELKAEAPKYMGASNIFCWVLNVMLNILVLFYMTEKESNINITRKRDYGYCSSITHGDNTESLYVVLFLFYDGFCLGFMICSSGSMVFILYRHNQRVQHMRKKNLSPRSSPEIRATQSILVLVCTFVCSWTLSSVFHICLVVFNNPSLWLVNTSTLLAACFPSVSPYILMRHDSRISGL